MIGCSKNLQGFIGFKSNIKCIVGVNKIERIKRQNILIDLKIKADFTNSVQNDNIQDTISYSELKKICKKVSEKEFYLLEKLGYEILNEISQKYENVLEMNIKLIKKIKKVKYYIELKV